MNPRSSRAFAALLFASLALPEIVWAQAPATPETKPAASADPIARLRDEGLNRSEVMTTLAALTDLNGPRLTGSPGLERASVWSRDKLTAWGLVNAHLEPWGPFGRGWELRRFSAQVIAPQSIPLIAFPKAWSPSLGPQPFEGDVVHVEIAKPEDFEKYRGKLKGKVVLDGPIVEMKLRFDPLALRRTEENLLRLANSDGTPQPRGSTTGNPTAAAAAANLATPEQRAATALTPQRYQFFAEEGVALLLQPSRIGESGTFFATGATVYPPRSAAPAAAEAKESDAAAKKKAAAPIRSISAWKTDAPPIIPQVILALEHFNRLARLARHGEKLRVSVELQAEYLTRDLMAANVVAEIPGGDRADEIVMLGAHLDSWHSGTGATDNAAGCAVVMEALRIIQALGLKPRRTIRLALWSGEEQGLLGSKAYVAEHFGKPKTPPPSAGGSDQTDPASFTPRPTVGEFEKKPGHDKLAAYFNLDNGGGRIRGVYLQNNEAVRGIFRQWLKPFKDLGAETLSLTSTGGTDHLSFDNIGLPGFQFIQDQIEYDTRTHHGNMDVLDRVVADDLKQASVIMAAFVYQTAMADEKLPRKPVRPTAPAPTPAATP